MEFKTLFGPGLGGPADNYRIPSIITTKNGVVVACADARCCGGMDNPNRIDKVIRRSFDGGKTWSEIITIFAEQGNEKMHSSAAIDPVMTYDSESGKIFLIYCHTPAGVGILNSKKSRGEDRNGNRYVNCGKKRFVQKGDKLFENGKPTEYTVCENGDVMKNGKREGNIFTGEVFAEEKTSYLMMMTSEDDGATWTKPVSLNKQVKDSRMGFIGPGPGIGIVLKKGKYKGRIVVPIYYGSWKTPLLLSCCVIYSDDKGETWHRGESPNNTRKLHGIRLNDRFLPATQQLTESQLIEQEDGTLKYFMRNHATCRSVATAYSKNGGESWEDFSWNEDLPQPICQLSVLKLEKTEKPTVVFLNPASKKGRENGIIRLSEDDGETFKWSRPLKEGTFVYSCMTELPNGNIGILFEPDLECVEIQYTEVSLDWIKGKE